MDVDPIGEDYEAYARDRARALGVIRRMRELACELLPGNPIERFVPSARERGELAEAIASLYAKRRARARRGS